MNYNPTSFNTPNPRLCKELENELCRRWVSVEDALPPKGLGVLVQMRGNECPAFGWLKFAAGDTTCPYFVVPQRAAMRERGLDGRDDVTHWWCPTPEGLPYSQRTSHDAPWGLGAKGWEPL